MNRQDGMNLMNITEATCQEYRASRQSLTE
jgi:hypothetical protein